MENRSKERLTGALILVAILVLLVPEMLSGRGVKAPAAAPSEPGRPTVTYTLPAGTDPSSATVDQSALTAKVPDLIQPVLPAPEKAPDLPPPEPVAAQAAAAAQPAEPAPQPVPGARAPKAKPVAAEPTVAADAKAKPKADAKAKPDAKSKPDAKTKADSKAKPDTAAWWVQVGSFSQRDNAQRLARDLTAKGYSAQVRDAGKSQFKVRVGPAKDRKAAQALQTKLVAAGYRGTVQAP